MKYVCVFQIKWLKIKILNFKFYFENWVEIIVGYTNHETHSLVLRAAEPEMGSEGWDLNPIGGKKNLVWLKDDKGL